MVNSKPSWHIVFIDYPKSRTAHLIYHPHFLGKGFDQCGLTRAHLSLKHPDFRFSSIGNKLSGSILYLIK